MVTPDFDAHPPRGKIDGTKPSWPCHTTYRPMAMPPTHRRILPSSVKLQNIRVET